MLLNYYIEHRKLSPCGFLAVFFVKSYQKNYFIINIDALVKSPIIVIPANAGIQNISKWLDSGSSLEWQNSGFPTFYGFINIPFLSSFFVL